ncbi:MAG: hypothetical protein NUV46_03370 [Nanoarchaeota archaeon]|nr:hypothetical protein [Nanoarchaeota archaeon]
MAKNHVGGKTEESGDNSQLILGLYELENPTGIVTIPNREVLPKNLELLMGQLSEGIVVASKSFFDERSVEFATKSKDEMITEYFK